MSVTLVVEEEEGDLQTKCDADDDIESLSESSQLGPVYHYDADSPVVRLYEGPLVYDECECFEEEQEEEDHVKQEDESFDNNNDDNEVEQPDIIIAPQLCSYSDQFKKRRIIESWTLLQENQSSNTNNNADDDDDDDSLVKELEEFDWQTYVATYEDLAHLTTKEAAWKHWRRHGRLEGRIFCRMNDDADAPHEIAGVNKMDPEFDWRAYVHNYPDLEHLNTRQKAWSHWCRYGKQEGRTYFVKNSDDPVPEDFDWEAYTEYHTDLTGLSRQDAWRHWVQHGKKEGRSYFVVMDPSFDWQQYVANYEDLSSISNEQDAWRHWLAHGRKEARSWQQPETTTTMTDERQLEEASAEDLPPPILIGGVWWKASYSSYGTHYFGWEGVLHAFKNRFSQEGIHLGQNPCLFFDEWLEKWLVWGRKQERQQYLNKTDWSVVSFLHNPPFEDRALYQTNVDVLTGDDRFYDDHIFSELATTGLQDRLCLLFTLSSSHKRYLWNKYPLYRNRIVSVLHPIDLPPDEELGHRFCYEAFLEKRRVLHIGWWLRNFGTFFQLPVASGFQKTVLIKDDFSTAWSHIYKYHKRQHYMRDIEILPQQTKEEYEKLFRDSCVFLDLVDGVANNTILECIRFHCPIFVRRSPSAEEYLGASYPLFFDQVEDLFYLQYTGVFLDMVSRGHQYLKDMDKSHLSLDTFFNRVVYEMRKVTTAFDWADWHCDDESLKDTLQDTCKLYPNADAFVVHPGTSVEVSLFDFRKLVEATTVIVRRELLHLYVMNPSSSSSSISPERFLEKLGNMGFNVFAITVAAQEK